MKKLVLIFALFSMVSCSQPIAPDANEAEIDAAKQAGVKMAQEALSKQEGSMEQENAILKIRARESELRNAGFPSCADSFAVSAERTLAPILK